MVLTKDQKFVIGTPLNTTTLVDKHISLQGTLQYTPDIPFWQKNSFYLSKHLATYELLHVADSYYPVTLRFPAYQNATTFWLLGGKNVRLDGGGTIDGNGQVWYDAL